MAPKSGYILAHDIGTGGDKAIISDLNGHVLFSEYQAYSISYPSPEWVEQDPDELWRAIAETSQKVIIKSGIDPKEIIGVGISAQMWNTLPVDDKGKPLMPMMSWLDLRSVKQAEVAVAGDNARFIYDHTGNIPTAKDSIPKILWLKEERPDIWKNTACLMDCKEYILFKLTGRMVTDYVGASVYFLFDPIRKRWSSEVCNRLGIPIEKLPEALPCTDIIGSITEEAARLTGLRAGTPVVNCAGDVAVAQSGAGANQENRVHLCIGTATWIGISTSTFKNIPDKPLWGLCHINPEKYIIAGEMETGGGALMWFRDVLCKEEKQHSTHIGRSTYDMINSMAESVPAGSDKLIFLPWLSGERAPVLDHYARGAYIGMAMSHTKNHMARAVMEGVAYHLRWICETIEGLGYNINAFNAVGGGCNSRVWVQIISDVTGKPMHVVKNHLEAGASGAALAVAVGLGVHKSMDDVDQLVEIDHVVNPSNPDDRRRYNDLYHVYRDLYTALIPTHRQLVEIP